MNNKLFNSNNMFCTKKEQGIALIGVLIVVALITASYSLLLYKQNELFNDTKFLLARSQIFNYFYSLQSLSKSALQENFNGRDKYDSYTQKWAIKLPPFPIDGGFISGYLLDRSAKLNINQILTIKDNTVKLRKKSNFNNCLTKLTSSLELPRIDDLIIDYLNNKDKKEKFNHISELKQVPGITKEYYQKLKPFLYASDEDIKININTASKEIIACLHNNIDEYMAQDIILNTPIKTIKELEDLLKVQLPYLSKKQITEQILPFVDIKSKYFQLNGEIKIGNTHFKAQSILINKGNGKISSYFRSFDHQL